MNASRGAPAVWAVLIALSLLGCGRKVRSRVSVDAAAGTQQPAAGVRPGLRLDQSLEYAVRDFVADLGASSSSGDLALIRALAGSETGDLAEWLLEFLGLPEDDAARVVAERTRAMGRPRYEAAITVVAAGLEKRGYRLTPRHLSTLLGRSP